MGDRANYVLINSGRVAIKHSQFGAITIASWMSRGPDAVMEMIKHHPSCPGIMDDNWCSGGIFLDIDNRLGLFFGDDAPEGGVGRRYFMRELRRKWPGWQIAHSVEGILEVAERLKTPFVELVYRNDPVDNDPNIPLTDDIQKQIVGIDEDLGFLLQRFRTRYPSRQFTRQLRSRSHITMGSSDDFCTYELSCHSVALLLCGPRVLPYLEKCNVVQSPPSDSVDGGLAIFPESKSIKIWFDTAHHATMDQCRREWLGWDVSFLDGGLNEQLQMFGINHEDGIPLSDVGSPSVRHSAEDLSRMLGAIAVEVLASDPDTKFASTFFVDFRPRDEAVSPDKNWHARYLDEVTKKLGPDPRSAPKSADELRRYVALQLKISRSLAVPQALLLLGLRILQLMRARADVCPDPRLPELLEARIRMFLAWNGVFVGDNLRRAESLCNSVPLDRDEASGFAPLRTLTLGQIHLIRAHLGLDTVKNGEIAAVLLRQARPRVSALDCDKVRLELDEAWALWYATQDLESVLSVTAGSRDQPIEYLEAKILRGVALRSSEDISNLQMSAKILEEALRSYVAATPEYWTAAVEWATTISKSVDSHMDLSEAVVRSATDLIETAAFQLLGSGRVLKSINAFTVLGLLSTDEATKQMAVSMALFAVEEIQFGLRAIRDSHQWLALHRPLYDNAIRHYIDRKMHADAVAMVERGRCRTLGAASFRRNLDSTGKFADLYDEYRNFYVRAERAKTAVGWPSQSLASVTRIDDFDLSELEKLEASIRQVDPTHLVPTPHNIMETAVKIAKRTRRVVTCLYMGPDRSYYCMISDHGIMDAGEYDRHILGPLCEEWANLIRQRPFGHKESNILDRVTAIVSPPIRSALSRSNQTRLAIIASGALGTLPLSALVNKGFGDSLDCIVCPSILLLQRCVERNRYDKRRNALVVIPDDSPLLAHDEGEIVKEQWRTDRSRCISVLQGGEATRDQVLKHLEQAALVHFVCHGEWRDDDILNSSLFLSHDSRITVEDLLTLQAFQPGALVVLAACESGIGLVGEAVSEEYGGLATACLLSGASAVIASLWPVSDRATFVLMKTFYSRLTSGRSPSEALAESQRVVATMTHSELSALLEKFSLKPDNEEPIPFSHPFYWAGFQLIGTQE